MGTTWCKWWGILRTPGLSGTAGALDGERMITSGWQGETDVELTPNLLTALDVLMDLAAMSSMCVVSVAFSLTPHTPWVLSLPRKCLVFLGYPHCIIHFVALNPFNATPLLLFDTSYPLGAKLA